MSQITLRDCVSILDELEESSAYARFRSLAIGFNKFTKGADAGQSFKKDGIYVNCEYVNRKWTVTELHLYGRKVSGFSPYPGDVAPGVTMAAGRAGLIAALGTPSSSGGNGALGAFDVLSKVWDRWDYDDYSLRFDYQPDKATVDLASVQRPCAVQKFEQWRAEQVAKAGGV